jgi:hypothetical protein
MELHSALLKEILLKPGPFKGFRISQKLLKCSKIFMVNSGGAIMFQKF